MHRDWVNMYYASQHKEELHWLVTVALEHSEIPPLFTVLSMRYIFLRLSDGTVTFQPKNQDLFLWCDWNFGLRDQILVS